MAITPADWATFNAGVPSGASNANATISPPTGLAAGDTWIIAVADWDGQSASFNTPTGFTKQSTSWNDGASGNCSVTLWYKPNCTGSETSVTITDTGGGTLFTGATWRHSGVATSTPFVDISDGLFNVQIAAGTATKLISPAAAHTPAQANEIVYFLAGDGSGQHNSAGGVTFSTPSGWTQLGVSNAGTTAANDRADLVVLYQVQTTATAIPISGTNSPATTATYPGNVQFGYGAVGVVISFYAGAGGPADPFPAGYGHPARALGNYLSRL